MFNFLTWPADSLHYVADGAEAQEVRPDMVHQHCKFHAAFVLCMALRGDKLKNCPCSYCSRSIAVCSDLYRDRRAADDYRLHWRTPANHPGRQELQALLLSIRKNYWPLLSGHAMGVFGSILPCAFACAAWRQKLEKHLVMASGPGTSPTDLLYVILFCKDIYTRL